MTDDRVELRACPFCGGEAKLIDELPDNRGSATEFDVYCAHCDLSSPGGHTWGTAAEAIAAWNTRTLDPSIESLQAEVERLREALEQAATDILVDALEEARQYVVPVFAGTTVVPDAAAIEDARAVIHKIDDVLITLKQPGGR